MLPLLLSTLADGSSVVDFCLEATMCCKMFSLFGWPSFRLQEKGCHYISTIILVWELKGRLTIFKIRLFCYSYLRRQNNLLFKKKKTKQSLSMDSFNFVIIYGFFCQYSSETCNWWNWYHKLYVNGLFNPYMKLIFFIQFFGDIDTCSTSCSCGY